MWNKNINGESMEVYGLYYKANSEYSYNWNNIIICGKLFERCL